MFKNKRYITRGVDENIPKIMQIIMWTLIDKLEIKKDYLQVFEFKEKDGKQYLLHSQEQPDYRREYSLDAGTPIFIGKVFVIDDGDHSTMLLASEY